MIWHAHSFVPDKGHKAIGMGKDLAEAYPAAMDIFNEVDEALGEKLSDLIWAGDIETLTLTQNAQPALMATSMAAFRALEADGAGYRGFGDGRGAFIGRIFSTCHGGGHFGCGHCAPVAFAR
jgi:[acyl-carrier-protein] S-malonyltransferase